MLLGREPRVRAEPVCAREGERRAERVEGRRFRPVAEVVERMFSG